MGGDYRKARLTFQEYFEKLGNRSSQDGVNHLQHYLVLLKLKWHLELPAIGGKDSMSGSFGDLDVPPTLVSFAVGVEKAK